MSLILSGLSRCGAWGCFDEFNRLQEATLSSISMLIQPLQTAIKEKQNTVRLANETVNNTDMHQFGCSPPLRFKFVDSVKFALRDICYIKSGW